MSTPAHPAVPATIWTIGHSTRPLDQLLGLLAEYRIEAIADVRSFPGSRKYPQYGKEMLAVTLAAHAIGYHWLGTLGRRRRVSPDSPNTAWRNASFRGYADYMASAEFAQGLVRLLAKFGIVRDKSNPNARGVDGSPDYIQRSVEAS